MKSKLIGECSDCGRMIWGYAPSMKCKRCLDQEGIKLAQRQFNMAKEFHDELVLHVCNALLHTTILPSFGSKAIKAQCDACKWVLDNYRRWKEFSMFDKVFRVSCEKDMKYGWFSHPLAMYSFIYLDRPIDYEELFARLNKAVSDVQTKCYITEHQAYDWSELFQVVGVTFKNGRISRQAILRKMKFGDSPYRNPVIRLSEYDFEEKPAIAVFSNEAQVGNIAAEDLDILLPRMKGFVCISDYEVIGGGRGEDSEPLSYGLIIRACFRDIE